MMMKTCVTVGEFLEHSKTPIKEGRQIWAENSKGNFEQHGYFLQIIGDEARIDYACNIVNLHVEKCYVQIEVEPIWL